MTDEHEMHQEHHDSSMGFVMGIILLIVALFLFAYYLLPAMRGTGQSFFPSRINVNIQQPVK